MRTEFSNRCYRYTGPLVAYLNGNDPDHVRCAELLESRTDDLLVTPYVVTETCYLVGKYVGCERSPPSDQRHFRAVTPAHITALTLLP